jgi:hypothetical protein|tara:strand:- start:14 stop:250 length:237 start_codon:yes stop_codon:yes gene_type:complete
MKTDNDIHFHSDHWYQKNAQDKIEKLKFHSMANTIAMLTFYEIDELVDALEDVSPSLPYTFQSALFENLKKRKNRSEK